LVARTAAALLTLWLGTADAALEVENAAGERVALALGADERALVVHFWASWCPDCGEELPGLERAARDCAGDMRVVAVNVGESADVARRFLERHNSALPLFRDPEGRVWRRLARGLPANLIWTRAGRRTEVGPKTPSDWEILLRSLGCHSMKIP
jgi:thiol-disulfide isomerase/thioredoxin